MRKSIFTAIVGCAICLSFGTTANALALEKPEAPDLSGLSASEANVLIAQYNADVDAYNAWLADEYRADVAEVEAYNAEADEYNASVDKTYEEAIQSATEQNAAIEAANQSELDRVATEEAANARAIAEAEAANAAIDAENAARAEAAEAARAHNEALEEEKAAHDAEVDAQYEAALAEEAARVEAHNAAEDARAAAAAEANARAIAAYESAFAQYKYDLAMEQKILAVGYSSVEHYNNTINAYYNNPAAAAIAANTSAKAKANPYTIEVAPGEPTETTYTVRVSHVYDVNGAEVYSNTDTYVAGLNDVVTVYSNAHFFDNTNPGYATHYRYISDDLIQGYWMESWAEAGYNALEWQTGWSCGDTYTFSYRNGGKYGVTDDIEIVYHYTWVALRTAKTYNVPVEPAYPELQDEVAHHITASEIEKGAYLEIALEDETFETLSHVEASVTTVREAEITELVEMPEKAEYRSHLDMPDAPEYLIPLDMVEVPAAPAKPVTHIIPSTPAPAAEEEEAIEDDETPLAETVETESIEESDESDDEPAILAIADDQTPLAGSASHTSGTGSWALFNLIFMVVSFLALLIARRKGEQDGEEGTEEAEGTRRTRINTGIALLAAIVSAVVFVLTENIFAPMALVDGWTILMAALAIIAIAAKLMNRKEDGEEAEAPAMG